MQEGRYHLVVLVAIRLDAVVGGGTLVRATVIFLFIENEGLSILETPPLWEYPGCPVLKDALEAMRKKGETQEKTKV